jgi:vitamin B12 transporter
VSWRGRFDRHSWAASLRHDDNSQFGGATTGSLAWGWQATPEWRLRASLGNAFRAPDFNELYYPGFEIAPGLSLFAGNPLLDPERSGPRKPASTGRLPRARAWDCRCIARAWKT